MLTVVYRFRNYLQLKKKKSVYIYILKNQNNYLMKLKHHILLHSLFWLLFLGLPITTSIITQMEHPGLEIYLLVYGAMNILNFYTCFTFVSKNVIKSMRALKYLWWLVPVLIIFTILRHYSGEILDYYYVYPDEDKYPWYIGMMQYFVTTLIYTVISVMISFFVGWIKAQQQKDELQKQSQQAEIALLRSQINPHFLFNTLNNLYSLVYRKSDEAPGALMKLSDILRYVLYECNTDKVSLKKELTYIQSYIELQQMRINTQNFIQFNITGNPEGKRISPMLLTTFIENAIKHGNKNVKAPGIIIDINCEDRIFKLQIINYLSENESINKDPQKGIGMQNVRRRLELIYPERHELSINIRQNAYYVKLTLLEL